MSLQTLLNIVNEWGSLIQLIATFVFSAFLVYFAYIQTKLIKREQKSPEWEIKNLKVVVQSEEYQDEYLVNFDIENVGEGRGESLIFRDIIPEESYSAGAIGINSKTTPIKVSKINPGEKVHINFRFIGIETLDRFLIVIEEDNKQQFIHLSVDEIKKNIIEASKGKQKTREN